MYEIFFTSGKSMIISADQAVRIGTMIENGCKQFQIFSDQNNEVLNAINLLQVTHIKKVKNNEQTSNSQSQ